MKGGRLDLPDLPGVLGADEVAQSAEHLARIQMPNGMIPWFPGGHCDPWNHVETAMALDVAGFHAEALAAYGWLVRAQLPGGAWHNYYQAGDRVEEAKLDTNVCAYVAAGAWHHWLCTQSRSDAELLWPTVDRALTWVLDQRRDDGLVLWAVEADGTRTWDYALLTGSSSIAHALLSGARLACVLGHRRPSWERAARVIIDAIVERPEAFEPKERFAMDWYYPVLGGALDVGSGKARLADGWSTFVMDGLGVRCVSDEPWITASETAEAAIAFATIGDFDTANDLLRWTHRHRRHDGSYWTGIVYAERGGEPIGEPANHDGRLVSTAEPAERAKPKRAAATGQTSPLEPSVVFPFDEHTSYTAAAVILAADAITGASPASHVFTAAEQFD